MNFDGNQTVIQNEAVRDSRYSKTYTTKKLNKNFFAKKFCLPASCILREPAALRRICWFLKHKLTFLKKQRSL